MADKVAYNVVKHFEVSTAIFYCTHSETVHESIYIHLYSTYNMVAQANNTYKQKYDK